MLARQGSWCYVFIDWQWMDSAGTLEKKLIHCWHWLLAKANGNCPSSFTRVGHLKSVSQTMKVFGGQMIEEAETFCLF